MKRSLFFAVILALAATNTHAGLFSRARTEGRRLDEGRSLVVEQVQVYSFLQDGAGVDGRLSRDVGRYLEVVAHALRAQSVSVKSQDMPPGTLQIHTTASGRAGVEGFESTLAEESRSEAAGVARAHRGGNAEEPNGYRLLLLPDKIVRSTGVQWGSRVIRTGGGNWFSRGPQTSGVPHYSFRVYWLLEDADDRPVAAGTTSAILDIRGFPHKAVSTQMLGELARLQIQWPGGVGADR